MVVGDGAAAARLESWFDAHEGLRDLRRRCHFHRFRTTDDLYRARYKVDLPADRTPAIVFAAPNGDVIYLASRTTLPSKPSQLHAELKSTFSVYRDAVASGGKDGGERRQGFSDERNDFRDSMIANRVRDSVLKDPSIRGLAAQAEDRLRKLGRDGLIGLFMCIAGGIWIGNLFSKR